MSLVSLSCGCVGPCGSLISVGSDDEVVRLLDFVSGYDACLRDVCAWLRGEAEEGRPRENHKVDRSLWRELTMMYVRTRPLADQLERGASRGASRHGDSDG